MRRRSREINIFNMSLLDILCGALGAFCFMMLVLMPYYKPPQSDQDIQKKQQEMQDELKKLNELKDRLKDASAAQDLADLIKKLESQIQELQGQLNQALAKAEALEKQLEAAKQQMENALAKADAAKKELEKKDQQLAQVTAEKEQWKDNVRKLEQENNQLAQENRRQESELRMLRQRQPFLVRAMCSDPQKDVGLWVHHPFSYRQSNGSERAVDLPFLPNTPHQRASHPGDLASWFEGHGAAVFLVRDVEPNANLKVYASLVKAPQNDEVSKVHVDTQQPFVGDQQFPDVTLTHEHPWVMVGQLLVNPDKPLVLHDATKEEREAEWKQVGSSAVPEKKEEMTLEERRKLIEQYSAQREKTKNNLRTRIAELEANPPKDREGAIKYQKELSELKAQLQQMEGLSHPK